MAGKPAATVGSNHICPMCTGTTPHVGGPITQGEPTVLIGGKPAATQGSMCVCVGPPDMIVQGEATVLVGGKPIAGVGDMSGHGGSITDGDPTVIIGSSLPEPKTTTFSIPEMQFPEFGLVNKVTGNAKEAAANQEALRKESESTEKEPHVFNLKWVKEETIVQKSKELKIVTLRAKVDNIPEGQTATIKVAKPVKKEGEAPEIVELNGTVKNKSVTVEWEIEEPKDE